MEPVSFPTLRPKGVSRLVRVSKCCWAKISVGAIKALMYPFLEHSHISAAATSVLPLPTSPWTRRFITVPELMSSIA